MAGGGRHHEARARELRAPRAGRSPPACAGRPRPRAAAPARPAAGRGRNPAPAGAFGQRSQRLSVSLASAVARSNGSNSQSGIVAARAAACRWRSAGSGGVLRSQGSGVSSQVVAAYSAVLNRRGARRLGIDLERAPAQPQQRRGVAVQRRAHRAREGGAQRRVEVAGEEDREHVHAREAPHSRPAAPVDHPAAQPAARQAIHEAARSATGSLVQGQRLRQSERSARGTASNVSQVERVRAVHLGHRVEHEAVHPRRVAQRVRRARPSCRTRSRTGPPARRRAARGSRRCRRPCRGSCRRPGAAPSRRAQAAAAAPAFSRFERSSALQRSSPERPRAALVVDHEVAVR